MVNISRDYRIVSVKELPGRLFKAAVNTGLIALNKVFVGANRSFKHFAVVVVNGVGIGDLGNKIPCHLYLIGVGDVGEICGGFFDGGNGDLILVAGIICADGAVFLASVLKSIFHDLVIAGYADVVEICGGLAGKALKGDNNKVVGGAVYHGVKLDLSGIPFAVCIFA